VEVNPGNFIEVSVQSECTAPNCETRVLPNAMLKERDRGASERSPAMLADTRPAIPLPIPKVAGYRVNRDRLLRWSATAVTTFTALIAVLFVSFLSLVLVLA